jgi:hypothetical protein
MAGGIDWFRSYHGTVNDPKFRVVAKKAGARVTEALAVWQTLLEQASASTDRGNPGDVDYEAIDTGLDMPEGTALALHEAFKAKGMIEAGTGRIARWEKRQPRREREDPTAADRKRLQRERDAAIGAGDGVTPRHATSRQEKPREEESREEENPTADAVGGGSALKRSDPPSAPPAFDGANESEIPARAVVTLSPQFDLPEQWGEDAERLGWTPDRILTEAEKFRQFFVVGKGAGTRRGLKGWRQGWSNWLSKAETPRYAR